MLALQLLVNGKLVTTAGTAGTMSVSCTVSAFGEELRELKPGTGPVILRLGGLTYRPNERASVASWLESLSCSVGDEITLRVLETEETDSPAVMPLPLGAELSLVPRPSMLTRLISFIAGSGRAAS